MPYRVRKVGKGPRPHKIQKRSGMKWKTVGSSASRKKALASARARNQGERRGR